MHSNQRMLEWVGFPGNTGTCRIAWKGWKVMNDWNVWNVWNDWNVWKDWKDWSVCKCLWKDLWLECLECPVEHTDGFLEDLLAFYA